jgi:hypothetical protein
VLPSDYVPVLEQRSLETVGGFFPVFDTTPLMARCSSVIGSLVGASPLCSPSTYAKWQQLIHRFSSPISDSLGFSFAFHAFCCRRGGWAIIRDGGFTIVGWHPNRWDTLLVFFPVTANPSKTLCTLLAELIELEVSFHICRAPEDAANSVCFELSNCPQLNTFHFKVVDEPILDWRYPTHELDTDAVVNCSGGKFEDVRRALRKFGDREIHFRMFQPDDTSALLSVEQRYASNFVIRNAGLALSREDLLATQRDMLSILKNQPTFLHSVVSEVDGQIVGLAVWEELLPTLANAIWFMFDPEFPGLSYAQLRQMCVLLKARDIRRLNFGGSETGGMNFFKTRFAPARSYKLQSISCARAMGI